MNISLKILGFNRFIVYQVFRVVDNLSDFVYVKIGMYTGSIATIRRLVARDYCVQDDSLIKIINSNLQGWY
jgi:hypothetical protein